MLTLWFIFYHFIEILTVQPVIWQKRTFLLFWFSWQQISVLFWNFCTLRGFGAFVYLEMAHTWTFTSAYNWLGGIIKEVEIKTNTWNLASNGLMFTKQKQKAKGLVQFMGGGKQLGRSFGTRSILNTCQKGESVMHPSTALLLSIQWCKRKKSMVSKCGQTAMIRGVCYSSKTILGWLSHRVVWTDGRHELFQ